MNWVPACSFLKLEGAVALPSSDEGFIRTSDVAGGAHVAGTRSFGCSIKAQMVPGAPGGAVPGVFPK